MAIATEREAGTDVGRQAAVRPGDSIGPPARLIDLLEENVADSVAWRERLARECVRELTPGGDAGGDGLKWSDFWLHACATGCAAARLAASSSVADSRTAFAAGFLHDLGKLSLARRFPRSYARAIEIAIERGAAILDTESSLFGVDHTSAGRRLAEAWSLPRSIVDAIWLHHQPAESLPERATRELVMVVAVADSVARGRWAGWGAGSDSAAEHAAQLGLSPATLASVENDLAEDVKPLVALVERRPAVESADSSSARVLSALLQLTRSARRGDSIAELCANAAEAVATGLGLSGACIIAAADGSDLLEIGAATADGPVWDRLPLITDRSPLSEIAGLRVCGARILPIPPQCGAILERFCGPSNGVAGWAMALLDGGRVVGALLLRAGAASVRDFTSDETPDASLLALLPAMIGQAIAADASAARGEELASGARRLSEARRAAAGVRSATAMAEFASGAAHELNTPLAVIVGRSDQLLSWELDPELARAVSAIREHAGRCAEIVNELAAFADPAAPQPTAIDVGAVLRATSMASIASGDFGAAECCVEISDDLPPITVDADHLRIVLRELLSNAIEATTGLERRLTIKAVRDRTDEQVVISVVDNGRGMEPEVRERAFDPFFSRRPAGRGRGLGLSRVRRLATLNGGQVRLKSEVGRGTVVEVTLPVSHVD